LSDVQGRSHGPDLRLPHLGLDHLGARQRLDEPDDVDGLETERRCKVPRVDRGAIALLREGQKQRGLELLDELVGELVLLLALGGFGHGEERKERSKKRKRRRKVAGLISESEGGRVFFFSPP